MSSGSIASNRSLPEASTAMGTARHPASVAPIAYVGYEIAGYSTVSRVGFRSRIHWGSVPTNSFVPMQAAIDDVATSIENRRSIQADIASRSGAEPIDAGYPRSAPEEPNALMTDAGGGSNGVPIDRSTTPPSWWLASGAKRSSRSYGYGGGTNGSAVI